MKRKASLEKLIQKHINLVVETVENLHETLTHWVNDDKDKVVRLYSKVAVVEKEADNLRREIVACLFTSSLEPDERSILLRIVREADWIADWSYEACRILRAIINCDCKIPSELKRHCIIMSNTINEAVLRVKEAIENLPKSPIKIIEKCDEVELLEEKVDDLYEQARIDFAKYGNELSGSIAALLLALFEAIENVADRCEDTCDRLREWAVRMG